MTLRCKPGDLAVIVLGGRNFGKLVTVIRPDCPNWWSVTSIGSPLFGSYFDGGPRTTAMSGVIPDIGLRPLRDQDGTDEVLRIAQRTA